MADYTLCTNDDCPFKDDCWRYYANNEKLEPRYQAYSHFKPEGEDCPMRIPFNKFKKDG